MRGSKRASPPADGESAEKKVKLSDGSAAPGGPSDSQPAATEAVGSTGADAAKTEAAGTSTGLGDGVVPAAIKTESDVGGQMKAEEGAALDSADVAVGKDDDVNTVVGCLGPVSSPAHADARVPIPNPSTLHADGAEPCVQVLC